MILSATEVYECLQLSCVSQTHQLQQAYMRKLQEFENYDGYVASLSEIIQTPNLLSDVRLLATICLKNLVDKCWTVRGRVRCLNITEKVMLRQFMAYFTNENDDRIAIQLAILTAKIARYDWPNDWPELLPSLFNKVCQDNMYSKFRCMFVLRSVLNEVSSKRALIQKFDCGFISAQLFYAMIVVWREIGIFILSMLVQLPMLHIPCEWNLSAVAILKHYANCTSVMHKLLSLGFDHLYKSIEIHHFFQDFLHQFTELSGFIRDRFIYSMYSEKEIEEIAKEDKNIIISEDDDEDGYACGSTNSSSNSTSDNEENNNMKGITYLVRKICYKMAILLVDLQKNHSLLFVPFLGSFVALFQSQLLLEYYNSDIQQDRIRYHHHHHPVVIAEILLLSNTLSCRAYSNPPTTNKSGRLSKTDHSLQVEENENMLLLFKKAKEIIASYFQPHICSELLAILLSNLLHITDSELLCWYSDPELFAEGLLGEVESDSVRTAAEGLFLGLLDNAPHVIVPAVMQQLQDSAFQKSISTDPNASPYVILRLDALYLCAGIGVAELSAAAIVEGEGIGIEKSILSYDYALGSHRWLTDICGRILADLCTSEPPTHMNKNGPLGSVKGCPVLKRRLLWMFSCWSFTLEVQSLEQLLHILVDDMVTSTATAFDTDDDDDKVAIVTLLQSVDTISSAIKTSEFKPRMLTAQLGALMQSLCQLTLRLEMSSFRSKVVNAIGDIILAMGPAIKQSLLPLTHHLYELWNISGNDNVTAHSESEDPLRPSLLETFSMVVREARFMSNTLHVVMIPILNQVVGKGDQDSCGFVEGITLWLSLIRNTCQYSEPLEQLYQRSVSSWLARGEAMRGQQEERELLMITQAYALIGGLPFLNNSGVLVMSLVNFLLGQSSARSVTWIMRPVEMFLISCHGAPIEVCGLLLHSGFITKMLQVCSASSKELGPYFADHLTAGVALVEFLNVFARILLLAEVGLEALRQAAEQMSVNTISGQTVLLETAKVLVEEFDAAGCAGAGTGRRKLWVVSLLSLFPTDDSMLTECFTDVLLTADGLLCEIEAEDEIDDEARSVGGPPGTLTMATAVLSVEGSGEVDEAGGDVELGSDDAHSPPFFDLDAKVEPIAQHLQSILSTDVYSMSLKALRRLILEKVNGMRLMIGELALNKMFENIDNSIMRRLFLYS